MRFALITDAWWPQVNGVVRTLSSLTRMLEAIGHEVLVIHPELFRTLPCPKYPSIRLAICPGREVGRLLDSFAPQAVHIATEGPLGLAARRHVRRRRWPWTSSYHTQFPKYLNLYFGLPERPGYGFLRWFHGGAVRTLVPTASMVSELAGWGFKHMVVWGRGVDLALFKPGDGGALDQFERPIYLNVGRVCVEKNLREFCQLDLPGSKVIVGDGPLLARLKREHRSVHYTGYLPDAQLAGVYGAADVFVFPSRTDTFGNVMLESMACGTPVAAYPVTGPIDVVQDGQTGSLDTDLRHAALGAMEIDRCQCRRFAEGLPWSRLVRQFESHLAVFR